MIYDLLLYILCVNIYTVIVSDVIKYRTFIIVKYCKYLVIALFSMSSYSYVTNCDDSYAI